MKVKERAEKILNYIRHLEKKTGINYEKGAPKHQERAEARKEIEAEKGSLPTHKMSHEVAQVTGFFSKGHHDNFDSTMRSFANFLAENRGGKSVDVVTEVGSRPVEKFLEAQVEKGYAYGTYENISSHMTKLQGVINKANEMAGSDRRVSFERAQDRTKEMAKEHLEQKVDARAYERPQDIIDNIKAEAHQLVASVQLEGGARINEASLIDEKRMGGLVELRGKEMGAINLQKGDAKGGLERTIHVSKETYQRIERYVQEHGKLHIEKGYQRDVYRDSIREAAKATGQEYTGSHGLRHNYAQARMELELSVGADRRDALAEISQEMGHFRPDITEHYLRK